MVVKATSPHGLAQEAIFTSVVPPALAVPRVAALNMSSRRRGPLTPMRPEVALWRLGENLSVRYTIDTVKKVRLAGLFLMPEEGLEPPTRGL